MWYRRQALKAIRVSLFREIRAHKGSAVGALLTGWVLWTLYVMSISPRITPYFFDINLDGPTIGLRISPSDPIGSVLTVLSAPVRLHTALNQPFSFAFAVALPFVAWALIGGLVAIIANLHLERITRHSGTVQLTIGFQRERQTAAVFLFAGSTLLLNLFLPDILSFICDVGPWTFPGVEFCVWPSRGLRRCFGRWDFARRNSNGWAAPR
jgi:hypothetical protein